MVINVNLTNIPRPEEPHCTVSGTAGIKMALPKDATHLHHSKMNKIVRARSLEVTRVAEAPRY